MSAPPVRYFVPVFAKVVNSTFGGGAAILGVLRRELVERRGWLSADQYNLAFGVSRITPGTSVLAFCTAAGWSFGSLRGAIFSLLAASVPCGLMTLLMVMSFEELKQNPWFATALRGAMASAIGIMLATAWGIFRPFFQPGSRVRYAAILTGSISMMLVFGLSPIPVLAAAATLGFAFPERRDA